jgi:integrase
MTERTRRANGDADPYWNEKRQRFELFVELPRGDDGKRRRKKVSGKTKTEARANARDVRRAVDETGNAPDELVTVGKVMSMFLDTLPGAGTVSDGTIEVYRRTDRLYITPQLGGKKLTHLQPRDVSSWLQGLRGEQGQPLSASTRRQARAVLRRAIRWAQNEGMVTRNVAAIAEGPRGRPRDVQPLELDQVRDLLAAANGYRHEAAIVLMLTCGLRSGETFGLRWGDLDLDGDPPTLTVTYQLQRRAEGLVLTQPKTSGSRRTVALPNIAVQALKKLRKEQGQERLALGAGKAGARDLVFSTVFGTPVDARNFGRELKRLGTDAGIDGVHPHRLRHSAVAVLLDAGVPLEAVSETVGHASIRTTKDIYGKLLGAGRARVASAMDEALG